MRIIAGKFKGRKLLEEYNKDIIRPTQDRVRESVFNVFATDVLGASILDIFCGTGSLGLEALSRGAGSVTFVDNDNKSITLAKKNLEKINIEKIKLSADFVQIDYQNFLKSTNKKFDIIFADPPYKLGENLNVLRTILETNCLADDGVIAYEVALGSVKNNVQNVELLIETHLKNMTEKFNFKVKNYGSKNVIFVRMANERN